MIYTKEIHGKTIKIEILESSTDILKKKQTFLHKNFKGRNYNSTVNKLKQNKLNYYILIRVLINNKVVYRYEELYKVKSKDEWIEVLTLMFQGFEQYEICESLLHILK